MATTWIKLNTAFQSFASGTTIQTDDSYSAVQSLLAADLAVVVANPGGTPPVFVPGQPQVAIGAQAATAVVNAEGASDTGGSITATALAAGMAAGVIATVTFAVPKTATPKSVTLHERSATAVSLYVSGKTATGFTVSSRTAAAASASLVFDYHVVA